MRFPPLHNTHPITIEINPSLKTSPAFIHIIRSAVIILSRSSPSSRRNLSGKISHFASSSRWPSYWACCLSQSYRQKSSTAAGQSGQGRVTRSLINTKNVTRILKSEIVEFNFTIPPVLIIWNTWKDQRHMCTVKHTASSVAAWYIGLYCTQCVSTNESRAVFVPTNPLEVLRRRRRRRRRTIVVSCWRAVSDGLVRKSRRWRKKKKKEKK